MLKRFRSTLGNKQAGATVYLGVVLMLMAFLVITICINVFQMYSIDVRAQLISDAVADGSAVAGQTPLGFDDVRMRTAASKIFDLNNTLSDATLSYDIEVTDEIVDGSYTGYKLVTVTVSGYSNYFYTDIVDFFDGSDDTMSEAFSVNAKSVVKAKAETTITNTLSQSFYENGRHLLPDVGIITTTPGNRLASYTTWLIDFYLCPEYNPIYQSTSSGTSKNGHLLLDYLKHMGLYSEPYSAESILTGPGRTAFSSYAVSGDITATEMQSKANSGEVVFIACRDVGTGAAEIYIVIPSKSALEDNCIAVAFANTAADNYKIINYEDFKTTHTEISVYWHI